MADGWSAMVIGSVIRSHFGKYFWSGHRPGRRSAKMMLDRTYDRIFVCGVVAESKNLCMKFLRRKATHMLPKLQTQRYECERGVIQCNARMLIE